MPAYPLPLFSHTRSDTSHFPQHHHQRWPSDNDTKLLCHSRLDPVCQEQKIYRKVSGLASTPPAIHPLTSRPRPWPAASRRQPFPPGVSAPRPATASGTKRTAAPPACPPLRSGCRTRGGGGRKGTCMPGTLKRRFHLSPALISACRVHGSLLDL